MRRITFSRYFPKTHPKAGQPTHFVEKILLGMGVDYFSPDYLAKLKLMNWGKEELCEQFFSSMWDLTVGNQYLGTKFHTIRRGHSWQYGDRICMVIWTGVPYRSPQLVFWEQVLVKRVWRLKITHPLFSISHEQKSVQNSVGGPIWTKLAYNDGLDSNDLIEWFGLEKDPIMGGQIICWNDGVSYLDGEFGNKEAHHE